MHSPCNDRAIASSHTHSHHDRLSRAGRAVVHRSVGDLHAGQLADHRLELKHRLQRSLRDLRLVRRIARQKLSALHKRVDNHRPIVSIYTGTQKARITRGIALSESTKLI